MSHVAGHISYAVTPLTSLREHSRWKSRPLAMRREICRQDLGLLSAVDSQVGLSTHSTGLSESNTVGGSLSATVGAIDVEGVSENTALGLELGVVEGAKLGVVEGAILGGML